MKEIFKVEPGQPVVIQAEEGLKGWVIQERRDGGKDVIINLGQKVAVIPDLPDNNDRNWPCG